MEKLKNLVVITNKYPNKFNPNILVFVQQLVWQFAKLGVNCTVISPMAVNIHPKYFKLKLFSKEKTDSGETITVLRPKYISLGQSKICGINPAKISVKFFEKCITRIIKKEKLNPDALYSHFITPAGIAAARIGRKINIPVFMAHGEATPKTIEVFGGVDEVAKELQTLNGVIAVSTHNKEMLVERNVFVADKICIFPNGYNPLRFMKINKEIARKQLGFNEYDFIVGFVGSFDNRKGILRLQEAVDRISNVKFACAGKGKIIPISKNCIYSKAINNEKLPIFYSACDVFVLPTLNEGCCNAIIEAMACGLPIVSSDLSFNDDILDETNSIRVDPNSVDQIEAAIRLLKDNLELRNKLSKGSLEKAKSLTLEKRAENILRFIEERI